jgi:hypothetical protein
MCAPRTRWLVWTLNPNRNNSIGTLCTNGRLVANRRQQSRCPAARHTVDKPDVEYHQLSCIPAVCSSKSLCTQMRDRRRIMRKWTLQLNCGLVRLQRLVAHGCVWAQGRKDTVVGIGQLRSRVEVENLLQTGYTLSYDIRFVYKVKTNLIESSCRLSTELRERGW